MKTGRPRTAHARQVANHADAAVRALALLLRDLADEPVLKDGLVRLMEGVEAVAAAPMREAARRQRIHLQFGLGETAAAGSA